LFEIAKDINNVYKYTAKGNLVAVITNGMAVLGLGDIGPEAQTSNGRKRFIV
jgi:malate dehydrogenase (oxaloacetate-decarboxylating)(NADP+)